MWASSSGECSALAIVERRQVSNSQVEAMSRYNIRQPAKMLLTHVDCVCVCVCVLAFVGLCVCLHVWIDTCRIGKRCNSSDVRCAWIRHGYNDQCRPVFCIVNPPLRLHVAALLSYYEIAAKTCFSFLPQANSGFTIAGRTTFISFSSS